jgi:polo-like kinase 1
MQEQKSTTETTENIAVQERITKKNGEVIVKKYTRGKVLGKGGFATCYELTDLEKNRMLAAKIVAKASLTKKRALEKLLAEIKIHKSLNQENIVQFEHVFEDKENVYILLEICPNQTLKELLKRRKRITELECAFYLTQTIGALKYLHERKIIHRDLKLGNLFLGKNFDIKLGDFGLAAKIEHDGERRRTICGTPNYIAPEVLDKKQGHSYEVDIWSLGVICYTLLIGKPPFETSDTKTTYKRILKNNYSFPSNVPISEEAKDLIKKILLLDPAKRPTLDDIMAHPFIKNNPSKPIVNQQNDSQGSSSLLKKNLTLQTNTSPRNIALNNGGLVSPSEKLFTPTNRNDINNELEKNIEGDELNERNSNPNLFSKERTNTLRTRPQSTDQRMRNFTYNGIIPKTLAGLKTNLMGDDSRTELDAFVSKWVDYSTKYGLGYLLSDGTSGVLFNDSTRMTLSPNANKIEYMEKKPEQKRELLSSFNPTNLPKEHNKKFLLLKHFKGYLNGDDKNNSDKDKEGEEEKSPENSIKRPLVYIKKWMKTKYAFMFRLSNRLVQVDFTDKTQIILSPENQVVHYRNKRGERTQHALGTALESEYAEMVKRLKYTKEILTHIHNAQNKEDFKSDFRMTTMASTKTDGFMATMGTMGSGKLQQVQGIEEADREI